MNRPIRCRHRIRTILILPLMLLLPSAVLADLEGFEAATASFDAGEYSAAEIHLKNLLRTDPALLDARLLLARVYLQVGKGAAAEKELRRAADLGADAALWRFDLAEALVLQGEFTELLEQFDVDAFPSAQRAQVLALRGRAYLGLQQLDDAKRAFAEALERDPSDPVAGIGLARVALMSGDTETAAATADRLLDQFPNEPDVRLLRADVYRQTSEPQAAIEQFDAVLELEPQNLNAMLGRAAVLVGLQQFDKARRDLDAIDARKPNIVGVSYLRGVMAFYERDWDEAAGYLQQVQGARPDNLQSQLLMGIVSYARNELQLAEEYLSRVLIGMPGNVQAVKVLAATRLKLREPERALELLEPLAAGGDAQIMALLGSAHMLAGDQESGQQWLSRAVDSAPDVAALRTQLALTLIAGGNTSDAIDELQTAVDLGQDLLQADVLLVLSELKEKRYDKAVAAGEALEQRRPDSPIAYNLTGLALLAQGKLDDARVRFAKALDLDPDFMTALINLARVDLSQQRPDEAEQHYRRVLEKEPRNLAALLGMAALAQIREDDRALEGWLGKAHDGNPTANQPGLLLSRHFIDRGDYLRALGVSRDLATRFPNDAAALEMLGRAQSLAGEEISAIRSFDQILEKNPDSPGILYLKGGAQWNAGDLDGAAASFARAAELQPDLVDARAAMASVLVAAESFDAALSVARALQSDYPDRELGFRIEGGVQLAARNPAAAVPPLRKAAAMAPSAELTRQLAEAQVRAGHPADAIATLEQWVSESPDDLASQAYLAMLLHGSGQEDRALPIYERLYETGQANAPLLNNLAWILHERGDARALEIAANAYELDPNRPEVADTYGWILYGSGERDRGLSILQQAYLINPQQAEIAYHTALALDGMGRREEAITILGRLLREHPDAEQTTAARALLKELGGDSGS